MRSDDQRLRLIECLFGFPFDPLEKLITRGDIVNQPNNLPGRPDLYENAISRQAPQEVQQMELTP